jgi:pimeloyl-ACP methyl ester carboxylesterase
MQRSRRVPIIGLLLVCLTGLGACGGSARPARKVHKATVTRVPTLTYRPGLPEHVHVADGGREGSLRLERVTYTSVDGELVPALFAIPTDSPPLGCLMYQGGLGQTKQQFPQLRKGAAALRLATFTIDPRDGGARGSVAQMEAAIKTPETLLKMVLDTVVDLRIGLDYLERRPECHNTIAYLGTSFGGVVGAIFTAQDPRIKAVVLTSIGPTFKEAILVGSVVAPHFPGLPVQVPGAATNPAIMAHAVSILGPYDPANMVAQIAPRPVMLINGRSDPLVLPVDALELAAAAGDPKTVLYFDGGHNPFAPGPDLNKVDLAVSEFLVNNLGLPNPF